jgi:hypothetical protein
MSRILTRNNLWKSVENSSGIVVAEAAESGPRQPIFSCGEDILQPSQNACSACAGDYEDPDRTAGTPDEEEDEEQLRDATRGRGLEGPEEEGECNGEFPAVEV